MNGNFQELSNPPSKEIIINVEDTNCRQWYGHRFLENSVIVVSMAPDEDFDKVKKKTALRRVDNHR